MMLVRSRTRLEIWAVMILIVVTFGGCEGIPKTYQGTFASADGKMTVKITADTVRFNSVNEVEQVAAGVISGNSIFKNLRKGATGIYIAPSIYMEQFGEGSSLPIAVRSSFPMPGFVESKTKLDVYAVFSTVAEEELSLPILNTAIYDAHLLYFQVDRTEQAALPAIEVGDWRSGVMVTESLESSYYSWQIGGGTSDMVSLLRQ